MIEDFDDLISEINSKCRLFIPDFNLVKRSGNYGLLVAVSGGSKKAVNRFGNGTGSEVSVQPWFDDYSIYMEIRQVRELSGTGRKHKAVVTPQQFSISVSVFKEVDKDDLVQLFRAEWDDFGNVIENTHPQPHWHIVSDLSVARTFEEYAGLAGDGGFMNLLKPAKDKVASLGKFHFAMNAGWGQGLSQGVSVESVRQVVDWLTGLLRSVRMELVYIARN